MQSGSHVDGIVSLCASKGVTCAHRKFRWSSAHTPEAGTQGDSVGLANQSRYHTGEGFGVRRARMAEAATEHGDLVTERHGACV